MYVSCHIYSTLTRHSNAFLSSVILIISGGRYNLWSHTLWSSIQFLIIFSHKILTNHQHHHCSQTQSFFNVTVQVSHSHLSKYYKNTQTVYISIVVFSESRKESKIFGICSEHYCKLISPQFLHSAIFIP